MPSRPSKGVVGKYIELAVSIVEEAEAFAKQRGESFKAVVEMALRRHMANPPPLPEPLPPPPLPPLTPLPPVSPQGVDSPATKPVAKRGKK
jgi:hypothetical protein